MELREFKQGISKLIRINENPSTLYNIPQNARSIVIEALQHGISIDEVASCTIEQLEYLVRLKVKDNISEIKG